MLHTARRAAPVRKDAQRDGFRIVRLEERIAPKGRPLGPICPGRRLCK